MKKLNLEVFIIASVLLAFAVIPLISAVSVTFVTPVASDTITGRFVFNLTNATQSWEPWICNISAKSSLTANSSWVIIFDADTNTNWSVIQWNGTVVTTNIEDANNYILNATCINNTDVYSTTIAGITVQNTGPSAPTSIIPSAKYTNTTNVYFAGTVTGTKTTSCILYFPRGNPGAPSYTLTHSENLCYTTIAKMSEGSYPFYIRASDETDTNNSAEQTLTIDVKTGATSAYEYLVEQGKMKRETSKTYSIVENPFGAKLGPIPIWLIIVVVIFAVVVYFIYKGKI